MARKGIIKNWGYGESYDRREAGGKYVRSSRRFVGNMNKHDFLFTISDGKPRGNWVKDRMGETGNAFEIALINKYPDSVICYDDYTNKIISIKPKYK